ncbi:MAG: hypothetical protein O3A06_07965 [Proteobacteria bacterium]|nr:hypothetical protein [Pseudomonadota bacterium]
MGPANSAGRVQASVNVEGSNPELGTGQANTAAAQSPSAATPRYFCTTIPPMEWPTRTSGRPIISTAPARSRA